jgi:hypothetical protein
MLAGSRRRWTASANNPWRRSLVRLGLQGRRAKLEFVSGLARRTGPATVRLAQTLRATDAPPAASREAGVDLSRWPEFWAGIFGPDPGPEPWTRILDPYPGPESWARIQDIRAGSEAGSQVWACAVCAAPILPFGIGPRPSQASGPNFGGEFDRADFVRANADPTATGRAPIAR